MIQWKVYFLFESPALDINWETVDPTILPQGSEDRIWVDQKAAQIREMHHACDTKVLEIYAMSDLMLFPKRLIEKYEIEDRFGDPQDTLVQRLVKAQINEMFTQFPSLDGLVVRIGEIYLHDAPFHKGSITQFVISSTEYGLYLYKIYQSLIFLADAEVRNGIVAMQKWILAYDEAWANYSQLAKTYQQLSTLYAKDYKLHIKNPADAKVSALRLKLYQN